LNLLPYLFVGLLAAGVVYFFYIRRKSPEVLELIESDLETSAALAQPAE